LCFSPASSIRPDDGQLLRPGCWVGPATWPSYNTAALPQPREGPTASIVEFDRGFAQSANQEVKISMM